MAHMERTVDDSILAGVFDGLEQIFTQLEENKMLDENLLQSAQSYMAIAFTLLSAALQEHNIRHMLQ